MGKFSSIKKKINWKKVTGTLLFISLLASIVYIVVMFILSPAGISAPETPDHVKGDYALMLLQCTLGLVVMLLPSVIERKWSISIPNYMNVLYFIFLYCAIFLGEVRNFYYAVPFWDLILHAFSGAMLGALGFTIVIMLNNSKGINLQLSPFFSAVFAFCFAMAIGAIWEIYEYAIDSTLGLNMQKYMLKDGTLLVGREALNDTMEDIIVDAVSALVISVIGYINAKRKEFWEAKKQA